MRCHGSDLNSFERCSIMFQRLMTSTSSAVIDFYPVEFEQDLNGKQQDWEAVVLIPFIDEVRSRTSRLVSLCDHFGEIVEVW